MNVTLKQVLEFAKYKPESLLPHHRLWEPYLRPGVVRPRSSKDVLNDIADLWENAIRRRAARGGLSLPEVPFLKHSRYEGYFNHIRQRYDRYFERQYGRALKSGRSEEESRKIALRKTRMYKNSDLYCKIPYSDLRRVSNDRFKKFMFWIMTGITAPSYLYQRWDRRHESNFKGVLAFDMTFSLTAAYLKPAVYVVEERGVFGKMFAEWIVGNYITGTESVLLEGYDDIRYKSMAERLINQYAASKSDVAFDVSSEELPVLAGNYGPDYALEIFAEKYRHDTGKTLSLEEYLKDFPDIMENLDGYLETLLQAQTEEELDGIVFDEKFEKDFAQYLANNHDEFDHDLIAILSEKMYEEMIQDHAWNWGDEDSQTISTTVPGLLPDIPDHDPTGIDRFFAVRTWEALRAPAGFLVYNHIYNRLCMWRHMPKTVFLYGFILQSFYRFFEKSVNYKYREGLSGQ
jgi:hypothetical protein